MNAKKVIPCLDVVNGRVIKNVNFFENTRDAGDPVEIAKYYNDNMADEIVFLDIKATVENRQIMLDVVKKTAEQITVPLSVGGGIRSIDDIEAVLAAGANKVGINTAAVKNKNLIAEASKKFGSKCITVAIDVKKIDTAKYSVLINAGKTDTRIDALEWAKECESLGAGAILLTSIDTDGTKDGYDIELYDIFSKAVQIPVIASGGCGKPEHILELFQKTNAESALAATVFHFKEILIPDLKQYLKDNGVDVIM